MILNLFTRIASEMWGVAVTAFKNGCTSSSCFQGWEADMLLLLQSKLNFTFKLTREDSKVGLELKNGSWIGTIGEFISYR